MQCRGFDGRVYTCKIREVPSSINKLRNLQVLVLNGCFNLVKLHPSITNLKMLIILDLDKCPIKYLPWGLRRLSYLQELYGFVVSHPRKLCASLLKIKELTTIRELQIRISDTTVISDNALDVLCQLKGIKVLAIDAEGCTRSDVFKMLDNLTPLLQVPTLQKLYLRNYLHKTMPNWFNPRLLPGNLKVCLCVSWGLR